MTEYNDTTFRAEYNGWLKLYNQNKAVAETHPDHAQLLAYHNQQKDKNKKKDKG
jgi:hypothetical protein